MHRFSCERAAVRRRRRARRRSAPRPRRGRAQRCRAALEHVDVRRQAARVHLDAGTHRKAATPSRRRARRRRQCIRPAAGRAVPEPTPSDRAPGQSRRGSQAHSDHRARRRQLAAGSGFASARAPRAVVSRCAGNRLRARGRPNASRARRDPAGGRRADLASVSSPQRSGSLSRHGGKRLRVPQALSPHSRPEVARARAPLRDACDRPAARRESGKQ